MKRRYTLIALLSSVFALPSHPQKGTAPNGYYPPGYNGSTFTGVVESTDTGQLTLLYTSGRKHERLLWRMERGIGFQQSGHAGDDITRLVVMDEADAPGTVDRLRLTASLKLTAAELHVSVRDLPSIAVFHLSKAAAAKLGLAVSSTVCSAGLTTRYEWWIIGEPSDLTYSFMAENTLENHFKLKVEDSERARILRSVLSRLDTTVDAKAFRKKG
jgi:hypothetical protein